MNEAEAKTIELIFGRWRSQMLYTSVTLGVVDALAGGPATPANSASELNVDAAALCRLMRAMSAVGILNQDDRQTFSLTPMGETLRRDHPRTAQWITALEGPQHYAARKHLPALTEKGAQDGLAGFCLTPQDIAQGLTDSLLKKRRERDSHEPRGDVRMQQKARWLGSDCRCTVFTWG